MKCYQYQRTIIKPVSCEGIGLHSGKRVNLKICPAPPNHGIKFTRSDLPNTPCIHAHFNQVVDTSLATVIGAEGCIVSTIEHLMAAFSGFAIDNALVQIDSYELPILDGSAGPFTELIKSAGIREQKSPRHYFVITAPIEINQDGKSVAIYPDLKYKITCTIDYSHPIIGLQTLTLPIEERSFEQEICRARTYGFLNELEYMQKYGLAKGGSLNNAVVLGQDCVLNEDGLRYPDEFVRHKVLDCIGDFSLLGMPIIGHVIAVRSGHAFNHAFLEKFFKEKSSWETKTAHELTAGTLDHPLNQIAV